MKKIILAAALFVAGIAAAQAENYNRVSVSYDWQHYSMKHSSFVSTSLNGFGLNYNHGFGVAEDMFVEAGLNFDFGFGTANTSEKGNFMSYTMQGKHKMTNINLRVPVNFVYRFGLTDDLTLAPYAGINFKLNLVTKYKVFVDTDIPDEDLQGMDMESDWVNVYKVGDGGFGHKDYTWNRFQMGWQVGVGLSYQRYYVGLEYGTDFIPAYSHKFDDKYDFKINTQALKLSLGYTF